MRFAIVLLAAVCLSLVSGCAKNVACDKAEACCKAYIDALGKSGAPAATLEAAKQNCGNIANLKMAGTGDACTQVLNAFKQSADATAKGLKDFTMPEACK